MARTEQANGDQRKAKKRKHENVSPQTGSESDGEVANKSFIVEVTRHEKEESVAVKSKSKRKLPEGFPSPKGGKQKRSKAAEDSNDKNDNEEEDDQMPTDAQLLEAAKPENKNAIVTVRQKKKQKHLERMEAQKDQSADKEAKRNIEYLQKWKNERSGWKFAKLRQISIQQSVFNEEVIDANIWSIALEYLASSSSAAKEVITKMANKVLEELDKKCEELEDESERQKILSSMRYQRARELLQSFD